MNIRAAIDAPRFHMQWMPDVIYMEPFAFSMDTQQILAFMGYRLQLGSPYHTTLWGRSEAIMVDPKTGMLYGGTDQRYGAGLALGY